MVCVLVVFGYWHLLFVWLFSLVVLFYWRVFGVVVLCRSFGLCFGSLILVLLLL